MKRFNKLVALTLAATTTLALAGCSDSGSADPQSGDGAEDSTASGEPVTVSLLIPGTLGDKSYFDSANKGMQDAKAKYGDQININVQELGTNSADYEPAILDAVEDGSNLVIAISWEMQEPLQNVASQYPDTNFMIIDTALDFDNNDISNSLSTIFDASEGSYLAGAYAAMVSETGIIGFLGGMDDVGIHEFAVGYIEGAKAINPDIKVLTSWVGSYNDAATAKTMALSQYDQGADIGFNVAGGSGLGQMQAAVEKDKWAIGVDADQYEIFKDEQPDLAAHIATSMVKAIDVAVLEAIDSYIDGTFAGGTTSVLGLESGAIYLVKNDQYKSLLTEEEMAKIDELEAQVASGEIDVPYAFDMTAEEIQATINSVKP